MGRWNFLAAAHPSRLSHSECRHRRHAVAIVGGKGFQVCDDAGATGGIEGRNGENHGHIGFSFATCMHSGKGSAAGPGTQSPLGGGNQSATEESGGEGAFPRQGSAGLRRSNLAFQPLLLRRPA